MDATRPQPKPAARESGPAQLGSALDVMRVLGTLAVLMYHASLTYLANPMRLTLWHVYDGSRHIGFDLFAYWVNGFAMPLFFLAAGVSAPAAVSSRGVRTFLEHRAGRLLRPLLFGCVVLLPICYVLAAYGLLVSGRMTADEVLNWRFNPEVDRHLYGLAHLWFLEYLFIVCVLWSAAWWVGRSLAARSSRAESGLAGWKILFDRLGNSAWQPLWLAIPTALIFLYDTDTVLRVENRVIPNPSRLAHYLYFFAAGGWLFRVGALKETLAKYAGVYLVLAAIDFALMSPLLLRLSTVPLAGWERLAFVTVASLFPWLAILGGVGACARWLPGKGPTLRYLAEASFWVYVIHLPLVQLMQGVLYPYPWMALIKFTLVNVVTIGVSLLTYEYAVRYSLVGEIINGARKRLKVRPRLGVEFGWIATAGVVLLAIGGSVWYLRVFLWQDNYYAVVPGQLYRSARLKSSELDAMIRRDGFKTVIAFSSSSKHLWTNEQEMLCRSRGVAFHQIALRGDRLPTAASVEELIGLLESSAKPVLVEGYRGLDPCAFASALGRMLQGASPRESLDQFDMTYAQFGGAEHSNLGAVLLAYDEWLAKTGQPHSPERLKSWTRQHYLVDSIPTRRGRVPGDPAEALAERPSPTLVR